MASVSIRKSGSVWGAYDEDGNLIRQFNTYEEALSFSKSNKSQGINVTTPTVGRDTFKTPEFKSNLPIKSTKSTVRKAIGRQSPTMLKSPSKSNSGGGSGFSKFASAAGTAATIVNVGSFLLCWVALEIYGERTDRYYLARYWIAVGWQGRIADQVRRLYRAYGERVAIIIRKHQWMKLFIKPFFDIAVYKGSNALKEK